jgi:hypothetical protein
VVVWNWYNSANAAEHVNEVAGLLAKATGGFDDKGDNLFSFY